MSLDDAELAQHQALIGQVIANKFRLVRLLGAGGMGAVYEAEDLLLKRRVALKLMKPEVARNKSMAERFIREGRAANAIEHKNIVRVFDLALDDEAGSLFIVQELLVGESLADRLDREHKLSVADTVVIMDSVLEALQFAHAKGIVHRDIKPDNVFLHRGADGEIVPKIIDFGISKVTAEQQEGLAKTQTGTALGTPYYMSPEQIRGDSDIDHRADLWSAGVMAFEMMTGQRPFSGENYNMLIINIITNPAPDATAVDPSVPSAISAVIARSLKMDRAQRYSDARSLRHAFDDAVLEADSRTSQVIALQPAPIAPAPSRATGAAAIPADSLVAMTIEPGAPRGDANKPRSPAFYALGALLAGLAIAGGAVGLSANHSNNASSASIASSTPATAAPPSATPVTPAIAPSAQQPAANTQPNGSVTAPVPNTQQNAPQTTAAVGTGTPAAPAVGVRGARTRVGSSATSAGPSTAAPESAPTVAAAQPERPAGTQPAQTAQPEPERPAVAPRAEPERPAAQTTPAAENTGSSSAPSGESASPSGAQPRRFRFVTGYPR